MTLKLIDLFNDDGEIHLVLDTGNVFVDFDITPQDLQNLRKIINEKPREVGAIEKAIIHDKRTGS